MITFPGIVEDLLAESIVNVVLIRVLVWSLDSNTLFIDLEAIVGPKRVIEGEGTLLPRCHIGQYSLRAILHNKNNELEE